ncbi:MAG: DUF6179 domain-containing protein [Sporolactobacillus sp.]
MTNPERHCVINSRQLSSDNYFQSLLEKAYAQGVLATRALEKMQMDCLDLLAQHVEAFQKGRSSSIPVEGAEHIMHSIFFTLGIAAKHYPYPDDAVIALQSRGVRALFNDGLKRTKRLVQSTRLLHATIVAHLIHSDNQFYTSTVVDGIHGFFKLYDPVFAAQDIHITADYPVFQPFEKLSGIEFIHKYLTCIYYENCFCGYFSDEAIHELLCGYSADYHTLLMNLYGPVLTSAIGCKLTGRPPRQLNLNADAVGLIGKRLEQESRTDIQALLEATVAELARDMRLPAALTGYLRRSCESLSVSVELAVKTGTLDHVFLIPVHGVYKPETQVVSLVKMDDANYRRVVQSLNQSRSTNGRIKMLRQEIHAFDDLVDLLLDVEWTEDEMLLVLAALAPAEQAALTRLYAAPLSRHEAELRSGEQRLRRSLIRLNKARLTYFGSTKFF